MVVGLGIGNVVVGCLLGLDHDIRDGISVVASLIEAAVSRVSW